MSRVLWRYGLGAMLPNLGLSRFIPRRRDREVDPRAAALALPVRLRLACEELGPVAIKLGQALGSRPDLLPLEYVREFRRLQADVPAFPFEAAREIVEGELEAPLDEKFSQFDEKPVAAASIGQVHFATLPGGKSVAVKVQRPEVEQVVETDLQILNFAAREAEKHFPVLKEYRVSEWTEEFSHSLRQELNYKTEGRNTDRLREALAGEDKVRAPRVHWEFSTRRVLVLERIEGVRVDDLEGLKKMGVRRSEIAEQLAQSALRQMLINGFFHADPHAGNLFVERDGRLVFLDSGNAASISRNMREALGRLLLAGLEENAVDICDELLSIGAAGEDTDLRQLRLDIERSVGRYSGMPTSEISIGETLEQIMGVVFRHKIIMPTVFISMLRAMTLAEGTCRQLDPEFDFYNAAGEVARDVFREWAQPRHIAQELWRGVRELHRYSMLLPRQISEMLAKTQAGGLKVKVESSNIEEPLHRLDIMCNRLAFALVVAAIIIGSSIMIASGTVMSLLSTHGALAYGLIGASMGLYLIYSIIKSGRL